MTDIVPYDTLNPASPLTRRTEDWIAILYTRAVDLVEQNHAEISADQAPWKLLTAEERLADAVETLDTERRAWNIEYQNLVDEQALELADSSIEAIRAAIANIVAMRRRKMLRWQKLDNYAQVKKLAKQTMVIPPGSQGRQIISFIDKQLDSVEAADVPPETTLAVLSREDAFSIATSRSLSQVVKDEELPQEGKDERIREIMEFAATTDTASSIRQKFINGNKLKIPRDVIKVGNDTLVTFVCSDEHEFSTLDRKTESISVQYGNAQPILAETQAARSKAELIKDFKVLWAICLSGASITLEQAQGYVHNAQEILDLFIELGIMTIKGEEYAVC